MEDPAEHALVVKALIDGLGGCVEWNEKEAKLVIEQYSLNPAFIRRETIRYVRARGGTVVEQRKELRPHWQDYRYYYMVILPFDGFRDGLFVEMRLTDDEDPEFPEVTFVRAHPEFKR
jgi:hypothetical protein